MRRPEAHDIDTAAKRIFQSQLPTDWIPREETPDYGVDYRVEIFQDGEKTGLVFGVQLKGKRSARSLRRIRGALSVTLESRNLRDYVDKERQPIFLVAIDVSKAVGYWLFLQQYADEELAGTDWRNKETVKVRIPIQNRLDDMAKLRAAILAADRYMAERHPASVEAAIKAKRRRLETLDPRFDLEITATETGQHIQLRPKQAVALGLKPVGNASVVHAKLSDALDRGIAVTFDSSEARITGSLLVENLTKNGFTLDATQSVTGEVTFSTVVNGATPALVKEISQVPITGGRKEARVDIQLPNAPFTIRLTLNLEDQRSGVGQIGFDISKWSNQPVRLLGYFETITNLVDHVSRGSDLVIQCSIRGNRWFQTVLTNNQLGPLAAAQEFLRVLDKARQISTHFQRDLVLPNDLIRLQEDDVAELYDLVTTGYARQKTPFIKYAFEIERNGVQAFLADKTKWPSELLLRGPVTFEIWGTRFPLDPCQVMWTQMSPKTDHATLRRLLRKKDLDAIPIEFCGNEFTETVSTYPMPTRLPNGPLT